MKQENNSEAWLGCPWCGEQPRVSKHYNRDVYSLIHRCKIFITMQTEWMELESLRKMWNTRNQLNKSANHEQNTKT